MRLEAAEAVGRLGSGNSRPHEGLRLLLRDQSPLVRIQALESLGLLQDLEVIPQIVERLSDDDPLVRAYAARAVADLGGASYASAIEDALRTETNEHARAGLTEALFLLGKSELLVELLALCLPLITMCGAR